MGAIESSLRSQATASKAAAKLRVLVIDEECPYPPNAGKRIRTWNLLSRLARHHAIDLLCYGPVSAEAAEAARIAGIELHVCDADITKSGAALYGDLLLNLFSSDPYSVDKHYTEAFRRQLEQLLGSRTYDLVHCEWGPYAKYLSRVSLPSVIMAHNVEAQIWQRRAESSKRVAERIFFRLQARKMQRFEKTHFKQANVVTAVSCLDRDLFMGWGCKHVEVVDNGVDLDRFQPADPTLEHDSELLFLASLDWFPNQDALWYFVNEVLPLVRATLPETRLRVAGRRFPKEQTDRLRAIEGVEFVGEIEDVREAYATAAVVVVPLRIGGGTRLKILEAMAVGKAVVSTTVGVEGLDTIADEHLLVADTSKDFAAKVVTLCQHPSQRRTLAANGRKLVESKYGWDALSDRMEAAWFCAVGRTQ